MTALEIVKQYESPEDSERIVDALIADGVALGTAGLWLGHKDDEGVHLSLIAC